MGTQPGRGCACVVGFELITVRIPRTFFVRVLRVFCFLRVLVSCPPPLASRCFFLQILEEFFNPPVPGGKKYQDRIEHEFFFSVS